MNIKSQSSNGYSNNAVGSEAMNYELDVAHVLVQLAHVHVHAHHLLQPKCKF